ncbi:hypothetical protein T4E_8676 [Trichinella pseudospiralis]|uniref:Uncharacterized protein n=1 Tax=Trichinella pseudospiralis TaxID=6337 RepID=A0A0V0XF26_TRIPS|nr:hypothetical protein T4E_8676 [Trichinella pseudospiralis]
MRKFSYCLEFPYASFQKPVRFLCHLLPFPLETMQALSISFQIKSNICQELCQEFSNHSILFAAWCHLFYIACLALYPFPSQYNHAHVLPCQMLVSCNMCQSSSTSLDNLKAALWPPYISTATGHDSGMGQHSLPAAMQTFYSATQYFLPTIVHRFLHALCCSILKAKQTTICYLIVTNNYSRQLSGAEAFHETIQLMTFSIVFLVSISSFCLFWYRFSWKEFLAILSAITFSFSQKTLLFLLYTVLLHSTHHGCCIALCHLPSTAEHAFCRFLDVLLPKRSELIVPYTCFGFKFYLNRGKFKGCAPLTFMNKSHRSCQKLHSNRTEKACNSLEEDSAETEQVRITSCSFLSGVTRTKIDAEAVKQNPPGGSLQVFLLTWRKRRRSKPQPATSSGRLLLLGGIWGQIRALWLKDRVQRESTVEGSRNAGKNCRQKGALGRQCVRIQLGGVWEWMKRCSANNGSMAE